jgi:hypothetical protein
MFGRSTEVSTPSSASATAPAATAGEQPPAAGAGEQGSAARAPRPVPPGLVPWLIPLLIVVVVVVVGVAPLLVALPLLALIFGSIGVALLRANRGQSYHELRGDDPLYRGFDDFRRGRGYRGLDDDRRPE